MTDLKLYKYFLDFINKSKTYTITPAKFNLIINASMMSWVNSIVPEKQFVQSRIDDLDGLYVVLKDPIPVDENAVNVFDKPDDYLYGSRAEFIVEYLNSSCHANGTSGRLNATLLKPDRVSAVMDSYYNKPTDSRLYFRYSQGKILLLTGLDSGVSETKGKQMFLEYYKYPELIEYIPGQEKSLELGRKQMLDVANRAAQEFLEKNRDPRYETYLREQIIKNRI